MSLLAASSLLIALVHADLAPLPEDAPAPAAPPASAAIDPAIEATLARLDPDVRARLESMDDAALDALSLRAQRGERLTPDEQRLVDALAQVTIAAFEAQLTFQRGDIDLGDGLARLHLGDEFRFLGPADSQRLLSEAWGNPPGDPPLGMIFPGAISPLDPQNGWGVVITYSQEGHVNDDDAADIDYDELLTQLRDATETANDLRRSQGYPALTLIGWAEAPHYAPDIHSLYWAQEIAAEGAAEHTLNYAIRVLGRRGVLELNAVAGARQLAAIKPEMERIFSRVEFADGNRYTDFDPDIDQVAAYGIGGLIAGKVAAKVGLWAAFVKILLAAKKFVLLGVVGLIAGIKAFLGRRKRNKTP